MDRNQPCEKRIDEMLERTIKDFKLALKAADGELNEEEKKIIEENYGMDPDNFDLIEWINNYALAYSDDPHYRAKKLELSWGGPSDYFLFFEDGTIEYHFLDWFDGAKRILDGEDYEIMQEIYDRVLNF